MKYFVIFILFFSICHAANFLVDKNNVIIMPLESDVLLIYDDDGRISYKNKRTGIYQTRSGIYFMRDVAVAIPEDIHISGKYKIDMAGNIVLNPNYDIDISTK